MNSSNISNLSQDKPYLNSSNGSVKSQSTSDAKDFSKVILNAHTNPMNVSGKQVFSKNDRNQNLTSFHQREMDTKKPAKTDLSVSSSNNQKITSTSTCNENPTIHSKDLEKAKSDFEKDVRETLKEDLGVRDEEITKAMADVAQEVKDGKLKVEDITEQTVTEHLATNFMPDPELLIRTGGELRISNYLLWQIAYSELYFCDTYWPDFMEEDLHKAIEDYQSRQRRFGKTEAQVEEKN